MKGKYNMNTKQNLFTEEELAKVTDEAERKHLIECAQDQSKVMENCPILPLNRLKKKKTRKEKKQWRT